MPVSERQQMEAKAHARALSLFRQQEERAGNISPLDAALLQRAITFLEHVSMGYEPPETGET